MDKQAIIAWGGGASVVDCWDLQKSRQVVIPVKGFWQAVNSGYWKEQLNGMENSNLGQVDTWVLSGAPVQTSEVRLARRVVHRDLDLLSNRLIHSVAWF